MYKTASQIADTVLEKIALPRWKKELELPHSSATKADMLSRLTDPRNLKPDMLEAGAKARGSLGGPYEGVHPSRARSNVAKAVTDIPAAQKNIIKGNLGLNDGIKQLGQHEKRLRLQKAAPKTSITKRLAATLRGKGFLQGGRGKALGILAALTAAGGLGAGIHSISSNSPEGTTAR